MARVVHVVLATLLAHVDGWVTTSQSIYGAQIGEIQNQMRGRPSIGPLRELGWLWYSPVNRDDTRGLGGGITWAMDAALCDLILPKFREDIFGAGKLVGCEEIHAAIVEGEVDFGIMFEPQSHRDLTVRAFVEVVLGFLTPPGHPLGALREARFSACANQPIVAPTDPLTVGQQVNMLEKLTSIELQRVAVSNNIQMITSLAMRGVGAGILTSLDVLTEIDRGLLNFTRITDPLVRPMTLALCTASARRPSHAAAMVLTEVENGFDKLGFAPSA